MAAKRSKSESPSPRWYRGADVPMAVIRRFARQVAERVGVVVGATRFAIAKPTGTQREAYRVASADLAREVAKLRTLIDVDAKELAKALDAAGAPWTPGRLPAWTDK